MSDTPRTDACVLENRPLSGSEYAEVPFDHLSHLARKLERETNALRARLAAAEAELSNTHENIAKFLENQKYMALDPRRTYSANEVLEIQKTTLVYIAAMIRRMGKV